MKLICPKCKNKLILYSKTFKCCNNHSYDLSKEGYVNLLLNKSDAGDNKEMVNARTNFLSKDYYLFLLESLIPLIKNGKVILDCGCGEGYYTNKIYESLDEDHSLYATDISKVAISKAAKRHKDKRINYFVSSIYDLPIEDKSIDIILNICAPLNEEELIRVLTNNGKIIKVIPAKDHLIELKQFLYENVYLNDEEVKMNSFKLLDKQEVRIKKRIANDDLKNLFMMTPYYYKTKKVDIERLYNQDFLDITFSFEILIFGDSHD